MAFTLKDLKYSFDALSRSIDALTMEIHHDKHHATYINNLNLALEKYPDLQSKSLEDLIKNIKQLPQDIQNSIRNNAGGHWNHDFFWDILTPSEKEISQNLKNEIEKNFESIEKFKELFKSSALSRFGSGWVWLIKLPNGDLKIVSTANQDNPLMDIVEENGAPILGLDVWEHAYYLKYQNKRADYVDAFWNVVDWDKVESLLLG